MFCTDPVSSCLRCSADLTGCDRASQQRALQKHLKDATRWLQIQVAEIIIFYNLMNPLAFFC